MQNLLLRFNSKVNLEDIRRELSETNSSQVIRQEVPTGTYEVKVEKMEIRETKKEDPMLSVWFRIINGNYKNQCIFYNRVLTSGKSISTASDFLKSLKTGAVIEFHDYVQYNNVIQNIYSTINDRRYEFALKLTKQNNGFDNHEITEVFQG